LAAGGAATRRRTAEGLGDGEHVGGLRRRGDVVARRVRRGDDDGATDVQARGAQLSGTQALAVVLRVSKAGLDLCDGVTSVGLRRRILALLLLAEERGQSDRGKDADDEDDDEELDERKALLVVAQLG